MQTARRLQAFDWVIPLLVASLPAAALAGFTDIGKVPEDELGRLRILNQTYGGTFQIDPAMSVNGTRSYTNGMVSALRVPDFTDRNDPVSVIGDPGGEGGAAADQFWADGIFAARALARFSPYTQTFGYFLGTSGGSFTPLFDVQGSELEVNGANDAIDLRQQQWRWARSGETGIHTSADVDNADGQDHMISYLISGIPGDEGSLRWALFFEAVDLGDPRRQGRTTFDYNDLAVEVLTGAAVPGTGGNGDGGGSSGSGGGAGVVIPLPPPFLPGLVTLSAAGIALLRQRRRRRI